MYAACLYSVRCSVYSVQCTVYSVQCTVYRVPAVLRPCGRAQLSRGGYHHLVVDHLPLHAEAHVPCTRDVHQALDYIDVFGVL